MDGADCGGFLPSAFCGALCAAPDFDAGGFAATFFVLPGCTAFVFLTFAFGAGFFAAAASIQLLVGQLKRRLGKSAGRADSMCVINAAGFTPAAAAALAAEAASAGCFGRPSMSGFTITWLS